MITISSSVGTAAVNLTKDVRAVQVMLLEINLISKEDFVKECLELTISNPTEAVREEILNAPTTTAGAQVLEITGGTEKLTDNQIRKTIEGITLLQKEKLNFRNFDGRIDPNGFTLRKLNEFYKRALRTRNVETKSNSIQIDGDRITLKLQIENNVATRFFSAAKTRAYILKNYNWNGAVKLMRSVFELQGEEYFSPSQLTGTSSDYELIVPSEGVAHILSAQLSAVTKKTKPTSANIHNLLAKIDGLPGSGFITKVLKGKSKNHFLSEAKNKSLKRLEDGTKLSPPDVKESHDDFYDFFRNIVRTRNGLWSDEPGIVNLVGFRRVVDKTFKTRYNDTLAVCLREETEDGKIVPKVELYIASTEPGNRKIDRQLVPQTIKLVPGLHYYRQPAGRTQNAIKQEKNSGSLTWEPGDTTMNFHQGANNFRYYGNSTSARNSWLTKFGFNWQIKLGETNILFDEQQLLNLNAVVSEIYLLLSRYGEDGKFAPYKRLKKKAALDLAENQGVTDGKIKVRLGRKIREIDIKKVKEWAVQYWFRRRSKSERGKFTDILRKLKVFDEKTVESWETMAKEDIVQALTDEKVEKIVEAQIKHFSKLEDIDGLPGQTFMKIIAGIYTPITQAKEDLERLKELFDELDSFPIMNVSTMVKRLKSSMVIRTWANREKIHLQVKKDPRVKAPVVENSTVGAYSQGCQIIYDTEVFYEFWTKLLKRAQQSGQEHWYYTLIDATKWKDVDWT